MYIEEDGITGVISFFCTHCFEPERESEHSTGTLLAELEDDAPAQTLPKAPSVDRDSPAAAGLPSEEQLLTEIRVLSEVTHPNIVPLLGSAHDGPQPLLRTARRSCVVVAISTCEHAAEVQHRYRCARA